MESYYYKIKNLLKIGKDVVSIVFVICMNKGTHSGKFHLISQRKERRRR